MKKEGSAKVTIKEIAEIAGVSIATVSLALNNKGNVKEETRKLIQDLAEEHGYVKKNQEIKKIFKKNILLIKYVGTGISIEKNGDFVAKIIDSIEQTAGESGYSITIKNILACDWQEHLYSIDQEQYSGIIFLSTEAEEPVGELMKTIKIPVVAVDNLFETVDMDAVSIDNRGGITDAVKYAYQMGHRKIGYINSSIKFMNIDHRREAYKKTIKSMELGYGSEYIIELMPTLEGAYENMLEFLNKGIKLPSIYIAGNDTMAIGAIKALKEYNLRVPEDISIIGFDDLPFCTMLDSPLTTMSVNKKRLGEESVNLLIQKIENHDIDTIKILVRPRLVERESVRKIINI